MPSPSPQLPTSHTYVSQRLRLNYLDWGNAEAPPLVLVHGGRDHARSWDFVAERLRDRWHVIAPDLRGHGDSEWSQDGVYAMPGYICDLAELVHQLELAPVTLIGHSLGGNIATRYAGIFPQQVKHLVSIEGLGLSPKAMAERLTKPLAERMRLWIKAQRNLAAVAPHRYQSIDAAIARMQQAHKHLTPAQADHLTRHGVRCSENGSGDSNGNSFWTWKFDPHLHVFPPVDIPVVEVERLWANVACPTLLIYGRQSWASNPAEDGRARHFANARVVMVENAGHWVHHNQTEFFIETVEAFLQGQ
jgi:pimeloyl-ACP methyl ester carboxylesterase